MLVLVAAPFVVGFFAVVFGIGSSFHALSDNAANELRVRDIGHYSVLLGPFSRDGWSHPGPAMYYALLLPYRLLGSNSSGMLAGALLINGIASVGTVLVARRIGGRAAMAVCAFALLVVAASLGAQFERNPWNPYITVLPFALLLVAAWGLAVGRLWFLPLLAFIATFEVQTHIGYLPIAGALVIWAAVGWAFAFRQDRAVGAPSTPMLGPLLATVVVLGVMWTPPLIDQLAGSGNLNTARAYFTRDSPTSGVRAGARVVAEAYTLSPDWFFGATPADQYGQPSSLSHTQWPILGATFLGVLALTWSRQSRAARQLAIGLTVAAGASVIALSRTPGAILDYRLRWLWLVGALTFGTTVWMAAHALLRNRRAMRVLGGCVGVVLLVSASAGVAVATDTEVPDAFRTRRLDAITRQVLHHLRPGPSPVVVRAAGFESTFSLAGLVLRLEEAGVRVRLDDTAAARLSYGAHRIRRPWQPATVLTIASDDGIEYFRRHTGYTEIAYAGGESPARRASDALLLRSLYERKKTGDHSDRLRREIERVVARRRAIAVFETRPG